MLHGSLLTQLVLWALSLVGEMQHWNLKYEMLRVPRALLAVSAENKQQQTPAVDCLLDEEGERPLAKPDSLLFLPMGFVSIKTFPMC